MIKAGLVVQNVIHWVGVLDADIGKEGGKVHNGGALNQALNLGACGAVLGVGEAVLGEASEETPGSRVVDISVGGLEHCVGLLTKLVGSTLSVLHEK